MQFVFKRRTLVCNIVQLNFDILTCEKLYEVNLGNAAPEPYVNKGFDVNQRNRWMNQISTLTRSAAFKTHNLYMSKSTSEPFSVLFGFSSISQYLKRGEEPGEVGEL